MLLHDRLQQALGQACRSEWRVAVMLLDLDDFKHTNDTLGHLVGDRLLQVVAARIGKVIRVNDTVARLGGDEFAIIQNGLQETDAAATLADRIVETVSEVYDIDGNEVYGTSIGITVFPDDTSSPEQLLSNADLALYRAKAQGGGTFQFFAPKMVEALRQRKGLERDLRRAMQRDELALVYQPQIDLTSRRIVGVEALLRWQSPECGLVSPSMFVSVAESTGLIRPIGDWVLREACRQAKSWADQGCPLRVAINVSPGQFRQQDMYEKMLEALSATSLPPICSSWRSPKACSSTTTPSHRFCSASQGLESGSRSTISAPAIPRSPASTAFPSVGSRSTSRSCRKSAPVPTPRPSCAR